MRLLARVLVVLIFFVPFLHGEGFGAGTLVKTPTGYVPIERLKVGDQVVSCADPAQDGSVGQGGDVLTSVVSAVSSRIVRNSILLGTVQGPLFVDPKQALWAGPGVGWVRAEAIVPGLVVPSLSGLDVIIESCYCTQEETVVYSIEVEKYHNFFVTRDDLLAHNLVFVAPALAEGLVFVACAIGACICAAKGRGTFTKDSRDQGVCAARFGQNGGNRCICGHVCDARCGCSCEHEGCPCGIRNHKSDGDLRSAPDRANRGAGPRQNRGGDSRNVKQDDCQKQNHEVKARAEKLGFRRAKNPPFNAHGQICFKKGGRWITRDIDGHRGGYWKMFDRDGVRMGTFDENLNKIAN